MSRDRVEVTSHARLRWLERVDAEEEYPAGAIRRAFARGTTIPGDVVDVVVDEATAASLVFHDGERGATVVTVLDAAIEYLDNGRGVGR